MHCLTAWGQWAVQRLQHTASLPGGSGQCNSCNALPHRLGTVGSGTPAMRRPTSWGDIVGETTVTAAACFGQLTLKFQTRQGVELEQRCCAWLKMVWDP